MRVFAKRWFLAFDSDWRARESNGRACLSECPIALGREADARVVRSEFRGVVQERCCIDHSIWSIPWHDSSLCKGCRFAIPGRAASRSCRFGLYFIVQEPSG